MNKYLPDPIEDGPPRPMTDAEVCERLRAVNPFTPTHLVIPADVMARLRPAYDRITGAKSRQQKREAWRLWRADVERVCREIERKSA